MSRCENCPGIATWIVTAIGAVAIAFLVWMSGYAHGKHDLRLQAVRDGIAEWKSDPDTGRGYIEWIKK